MYTPERLTIKNLLSHKHTSWEFPKGEATLIVGENRDDDGQESNGSGKSALIEAISIAITGKPFRKVKDVDLIYYGEKECNINLELVNQIKGEKVSISRTLFSKSKSSTLECFINGEPVTSFPTVLDGNKWILSKIGLSREDIINYFIVSKSKSVSFFGQSDTDKKSIVSRFSGTDPLMPIKVTISDESKKMEAEKSELDSSMLRLIGKGEAFQEQLETASTDDQKALKQSRINSRKENIEQYQSSILQSQEKLMLFNNELSKINKDLHSKLADQDSFKANEVDYTAELLAAKKKDEDNGKKILEISSEINEYQKVLQEFKSFKNEIEVNLADSIECPKCHHKFILRDVSYNLEEAKAQLPVVVDEIEQLENAIEDENKRIGELKDIQSGINEEIGKIRRKAQDQDDERAKIVRGITNIQTDLHNKKQEIASAETRIVHAEKSIKELEVEIEGIKNEKIVDPSLEIGRSIQKNQEEIKELDAKCDQLKEKYVKHKEFEVIFTKFITHLSNKAVKSIEIKTNEYLQNMGSNLSIEIEGYKVNADGSIREKFTTVVARDGIPEAFFESFSEGEQGRIIIATTLALNSLLNMSCENGQGLSIVVLDELMGSLDPLGVGLTMEALNTLKQTILAISHVEPRHKYLNTVTVVKENGNSQIQ